MEPAPVETIRHDLEGRPLSADAFLDFLRPSHDHWHIRQPLEPEESISGFPMYVAESQWVFRGQRYIQA